MQHAGSWIGSEARLLWRFVRDVLLMSRESVVERMLSILGPVLVPLVVVLVGSVFGWSSEVLGVGAAMSLVLTLAVNPYRHWRDLALRAEPPLRVVGLERNHLSLPVGAYWGLDIKNVTDEAVADCGGEILGIVELWQGRRDYMKGPLQWSSRYAGPGHERMTVPAGRSRVLDLIYLDPKWGVENGVEKPATSRLLFTGGTDFIEHQSLPTGVKYRLLVAVAPLNRGAVFAVCLWGSDGFIRNTTCDIIYAGTDETEARRVFETGDVPSVGRDLPQTTAPAEVG
jgi:hypothetical protein